MRKRGFTLLEVIVAFTLVSILLFFFLDFSSMSKVAQTKADLRTRAETIALRAIDENMQHAPGHRSESVVKERAAEFQVKVQVLPLAPYPPDQCRLVRAVVTTSPRGYTPVSVTREERVGDLPL